MIFDTLANSNRYKALHSNFSKAFHFLHRSDLGDLTEGKYEIEGNTVFAMISKDQGRAKDAALLEVHNKYIDIQLVLSGIDEMGWKARSACTEGCEAYDPEGDIQFFSDQPSAWFSTRPDDFAIFFPEDAHLPLIGPGIIHKVVVKIAI
ncbi:MAG: YhcH/YjgK/YiaL family protein [Desulfotalea sp.]|nr:MAG: YhcH/YjgK/YiaL family protein [Desulfotalea sp.]